MELSEDELRCLEAAKLIFGDAKPSIMSHHKVLLAALDDRIAGKISQPELQDLCFKWALEYAFDDYRLEPLPGEPTQVTEWKYMDQKLKDKMDDRTEKYYEFALIGYTRACSSVKSKNYAVLLHLEELVEHFKKTGDMERENKARTKLEDLRSLSATLL